MSHNTEKSENSPESPHLGEIKRMHKQCVPGTPPFFACGRDEAKGFKACLPKFFLMAMRPFLDQNNASQRPDDGVPQA